METDEKIDLAISLSTYLQDVRKTEWSKFLEYFKTTRNLNKTLILTSKLSQSPMLRPGPKKQYAQISQTLTRNKNMLSKFSVGELLEVFGYIKWCIP